MNLLTQAQCEQIRAGLRDRRSRLAAGLRARLHENGMDVPPGLHRYLADELDTADAAEQFADDLAWLGHEADSLRRTDAALQRLAEHRYGICECCGEPIPAERLLAMPAAARCLPCQQLAERAAGRGGRDEY